MDRTPPSYEGEEYAIASLCAVPHSTADDIYKDFNEFVTWLQPQDLIRYDPGGVWLPLSSRGFSSQGLILFENSAGSQRGGWSSYLFAGRDGYFEYGRQAGWNYQDHWCYPFAPMIAWIQRFAALVQEAKAKQATELPYSLTLNLSQREGAELTYLGQGWEDRFRRSCCSNCYRDIRAATYSSPQRLTSGYRVLVCRTS